MRRVITSLLQMILGDMADQAAEYRTELIEKICELDDDLMMQYLEGEEPSVDDMKKVDS